MKKFLTALLSIVMCFSVPSVSVSAEEPDLSGPEEEISEPAGEETESQEKEEKEDPEAESSKQEKEPAPSEEPANPDAEEEPDSEEPVNEESDPEEKQTEEEGEASAEEVSETGEERGSEEMGVIDPVSDFADDNFEWKLYSNGKAELIKYIGESAEAEIPAEVNGKTVSCIREYAFENNTGLTGVTIPAGVTEIAYRAFGGCTNLQRVDFYANISKIGNRAFEGCSKLTSVGGIDSNANIRLGFTGSLGRMFRENVSVYEDEWELENGPHLGRHITSVSLPANITALEASAFEGCLNLSEITIPESVTSIGMFAFHYCHSLSEIRIPDSVKSIGEGAFRYCDHLTGIHIPASVTSIGSIDPFTLKYKLFDGCRNLVSLTVDPANPMYDSRENCNALIETASNTMIAGISTSVIPASVTALHSEAFYECAGLKSIVIPASVKTMGKAVFATSGLENAVIEEGVAAIPDYTFSDCASLQTLDIPKSVTSIGDGAISTWIENLTITYHGSKSDWEAIRGTEEIENVTINYLEPDDPQPSPEDPSFEWKVYSNGTADLLRYIGDDAVVVIPEKIEGKTVTRICEGAFRNNTEITDVTIPAGITEIGMEAFCGCVNLERLDFNAENCEVYDGAFLGCEKLKTAGGKDSNANIRLGFTGTLKRLFRTFGEKDEDGNWQFYGGSGLGLYLTSADVPAGITVLGSDAFSGCINLTELHLPEGLITISPQAFHDCVKLAEIEIPSSVTTIGEEAFRNCESLTEFHLPANVSSLGTLDPFVLKYHLFSGCKNLRSLTVDPENPVYDSRDNCNAIIETAGNKLIQGIGTTVIPASVTEINTEAFFDCKEITSITIPGTVEKIGTGAFYNSGLKTVVIEEGVTELPASVFANCNDLETVELPHSLTAVDMNSIVKKDGDYTIIYHGTPEEWQEVFQFYALHQATMIYVIPVKEVKISEEEATAAVNSSIRLSAEVLPQDAANKKVFWTTSNPDVAAVDQSGNVTAVSKGEAVITVTTEDGNKTASCKVTVIVPVTGIHLDKTSLTLSKKQTYQLNAEVTPKEASNPNILWSSSKETVASVSKTGLITAFAEGEATITAASEMNPEIRASVTVTVTRIRPESISFTKRDVTVREQETKQLSVIITPEDAENKKVIYRSNDQKIAKVDENGKVTGIKEGTTEIIAETEDGGLTDQCIVTVRASGIRAELPQENYAYTGNPIKPAVQVFDGNVPLAEKTEYTVSYKNNTKVGTATVTVTGKGNYSSILEVNFTIDPVDMEQTEAEEITLIQSAKPKTLTVSPKVTWNGKTLKAGTDYTIDPNGWDYVEAGDHVILLKGKGNFDGEKQVTVHVIAPEQTSVTKLKVKTETIAYREGISIDDVAEAVTVMDGKKLLTRNEDYFISDDQNCDRAGTCTFVLSGDGKNYFGTRTVSVTVKGTSISGVKVSGSVKYDGNPKMLGDGIVLTLNKKEIKQDTDFTVLEDTYENNINAGKASVTICGMKGISGTKKITFTISPDNAEKDSIVTVKDTVYAKGGAVPEVTIEGLREGIDYKLSFKNNKEAGTNAAVTVSFLGNYKGSPEVKREFIIERQDLANVHVIAPDVVWKKKAGNYKAKIAVYDQDGKKLSSGSDYDKTILYLDEEGNPLDEKAIVPSGTKVTAVLTGKGNYKETAMFTYEVKDAVLDLSKATIKVRDQEYTGDEIEIDGDDIASASIKIGKKSENIEFGKDFDVLVYENNVKKGTAKVTFAGKGEYSGTKTVTFKIKQRTVKND